jgi:hypothetical protein
MTGESVASTMESTLMSLHVDAGDQSHRSGPPMHETSVHVSICRRDGLVKNDSANPRLLSSRALRLHDDVCGFLSIDSDCLPFDASEGNEIGKTFT